MRVGVLAAMTAVMVVAGCATVRDSRINPLNWFGRSQATAPVGTVVRDGGRIPVQQVTELHIEQTQGGAIIRAKGLPPSQGWYHGELVREVTDNPDDLVYRFVLRRPNAAHRIGTPVSREVTVATFVSDFRLEGVRSITVTGAENARTTRRR